METYIPLFLWWLFGNICIWIDMDKGEFDFTFQNLVVSLVLLSWIDPAFRIAMLTKIYLGRIKRRYGAC